MRILFTCGREPQYPRNIILRACLANNYDVRALVDATPQLPLRYVRLALKLMTRPGHDLACVGFLGQPLVPIMRLVTRRPILFDAFISVYDTLCFDRRRFSPRSAPGRAAFMLDRLSCTLADHILLDTTAHIDYFHRTFGVPYRKMSRLFVGCDERLFFPRPFAGPGYVLFYGTYLPLHGIDIIIRAAKILQDTDSLVFRLIGAGPQYASIRRIAQELGVKNVEFLPPVPLIELPEQIAGATICLGGHFAPSAKAQRVIAGKTYQCLAMGRPTIVADNGANGELLTHGYDAWFCPPDDPAALACAIRDLMAQPGLRARLGENARATFLERASIRSLSVEIREIVGGMSN